ncbi:hypothetical protein C8T65DRAFT_528516, partial [Cerioporus squamosus]
KAKTAEKQPPDSSGSESDGQGVLRKVEAVKDKHGIRRGPENKTLKHWHDAVPVKDKQ